jgi:predicted amidohydrolase
LNDFSVSLIQIGPSINAEGDVSRVYELALSIPEPADVMLLPEMRPCGDETSAGSSRVVEAISEFCAERGGFAVSGGLPWDGGGERTIRTWITDDAGRLFAFYDKVHLCSKDGEDKIYSPGRYARLWNTGEALCAAISGYDLMFPEFCRQISAAGAQILFVSAQWKEELFAAWEPVLRATAFTSQCYVAACNRTGEQGGEKFFGRSAVVSPRGEIIAQMGAEEGALKIDFNLSDIERCKKDIPLERDRRGDIYVTLR